MPPVIVYFQPFPQFVYQNEKHFLIAVYITCEYLLNESMTGFCLILTFYLASLF